MTQAAPVPSTPAAKPPTIGLAIASLICGIASLVLLLCSLVVCPGIGLLPGIAGIILGHLASKKIRASGGTLGGAGMTKAGLITSYVGAILSILIAVVLILIVGSLAIVGAAAK